MSLDSLLESLEKVTLVTSQDGQTLPIKPFKNNKVTSVTPVTSQKTKPEIIFDETRMNKGSSNSVTPVTRVTPENDSFEKKSADIEETQRESRRAKVLAILAANPNPNTKRAIITDMDSDPKNVIVTVAIRGQYSFELLIDRSKYDPFIMLEILERGGVQ